MADFSRQIATAKRLIAKNGMSMTFDRITEGKDPETGKTVKTHELSEFMGVKLSLKAEEITAGMFPLDSVIVLVAGGDIPTPDTTDELQFNGNRWEINNILTVAPAEQDIVYKLVVVDIGSV